MFIFYMCGAMCICAHVHLPVCVCVLECRGQREDVPLCQLPHDALDTGPSLNLELSMWELGW